MLLTCSTGMRSGVGPAARARPFPPAVPPPPAKGRYGRIEALLMMNKPPMIAAGTVIAMIAARVSRIRWSRKQR